MIPATERQAASARLLHVDARGQLRHLARRSFIDLLRSGDVVVANDAATLPASLNATLKRTGDSIEVRLAGRKSMQPSVDCEFTAVTFGAGDYRTRTEDRPAPPRLIEGDELQVGPLTALVARLLDHPRLIAVRFDATPARFWQAIALHGRPIQYAHVHRPLALWDVWPAIAAQPVAYEAPSAGFALSWQTLHAMHEKGVIFTTLTHAAGISSTGDIGLDARLPFDEPYFIPAMTADAVNKARGSARRIIAIGTTVVRALEHAGASGIIRAGEAVATQRLGKHSRLQIVDVILSGTHETGTSHYELLRAFTSDATLQRADRALTALDYRTHEFGDSLLIERYTGCPQRSLDVVAAIEPQVSRAYYGASWAAGTLAAERNCLMSNACGFAGLADRG